MNKVVYSCITGGYDNIPVHKYVAPDWDYILFTDNQELIKKGYYEHWKIKPISFNKLDNTRNSRHPKVKAHIVLPEYNYSLYLDANIIVNNDNLFKLLDKLIKQNVLIAVPNHPKRKCIYDEAEIIKSLKIDFPEIVDKEMMFLRDEKYPIKNGLTENNILFRQHNKIKKTSNLWWNMIKTYSKRDQLSFMYCLWKTGLKYTPIYTDENGFGYHHKTEDFTFIYAKSHNQGKIENKKHFSLFNLFIRIIGSLIPIQKYRRNFKQKFIQD